MFKALLTATDTKLIYVHLHIHLHAHKIYQQDPDSVLTRPLHAQNSAGKTLLWEQM